MAEYGCVLAHIKVPKSYKKIFKIIDKADLAEDGFEKETHVTVCYGLHSDVETAQVRKVLEGIDLREIRVSGMSLFENETDVLKLDVKVTAGLKLLRDSCMKLPNTQTFPDFKPHITIAYLKKGTGKKYLPSFKFDEFALEVDDIVYSYADRTEEKIYESMITGKKKRIL